MSLLLEKEAIERVQDLGSLGFLQSLIPSSQELGGWRQVLDVSALNVFVRKTKFTKETTKSVLTAFRKDDWMVSLDLQDAYFHSPIHPNFKKYLRFVYKEEVFQFEALCFVLSTTPQIFTKVMSNVAGMLHSRGIRASLYLNDWLLRAPSYICCLEDLQMTVNLSEELGFLIKKDKSQLTTSQEILYLGMEIQSRAFRAFPSASRTEQALVKL
ncbi:uncharacterized protein [Palaemon carinicauda]|uniref:uncharacterized protein n=1 Tax=Palaemon carinicauda TaxID=392227 RepID=UPI0035B61993